MRNITYKYNVGDWVILKRKYWICDEIDENGIECRISIVQITDRRDYNGPCYKFYDVKGYYQEACIQQKCLEFPADV